MTARNATSPRGPGTGRGAGAPRPTRGGRAGGRASSARAAAGPPASRIGGRCGPPAAASTAVPLASDPPGGRRGERAAAPGIGSDPPASPREEARQALLPGGRQDGVDRVVDGHDPHEPAVVVDDRDGEQVVVGDDLGDLVLVGHHADGDRLVIITSAIGVAGGATIRSRSESTPTSRPSSSTT